MTAIDASQRDVELGALTIGSLVADLDLAIDTWVGDLDLARSLAVYRDLKDVSKALAIARDALANRIGEKMGPHTVVVPEIGTVKRHRNIRRTNWDSEALLRDVLDSRIFDRDSGELVEETPLERVRAVYPLAGYQARVRALWARNLNPDEYAEAEDLGWKLEIR